MSEKAGVDEPLVVDQERIQIDPTARRIIEGWVSPNTETSVVGYGKECLFAETVRNGAEISNLFRDGADGTEIDFQATYYGLSAIGAKIVVQGSSGEEFIVSGIFPHRATQEDSARRVIRNQQPELLSVYIKDESEESGRRLILDLQLPNSSLTKEHLRGRVIIYDDSGKEISVSPDDSWRIQTSEGKLKEGLELVKKLRLELGVGAPD